MGAYTSLVKSNEPNAKKRFGQHFLRDTGVLDRIIRWINPDPNDLFLEIGAGAGALSVRLAESVGELLAVEVDRECIPVLQSALEPFKNVTILFEDILSLDLAEFEKTYLRPGRKLIVVGNLPYNIATAIIGKLIRSRLPIQAMFFMIQLEVAERILAHPRTREYGYLSVECQHHAHVRMGFKVSPACFVPRPKVNSAVISMHPKPCLHEAAWEYAFEELCKASFAYRRKTLSNSLRKHLQFGPIADALLIKAGIDGSRRAEDLSLQEYETLADIYRQEFSQNP
jgi:16S rRNA (adenine1518-N6/adenine1519-N6)-dimethyltransferase